MSLYSDDINQMIEELEEAGIEEGTETGESWRALADMQRFAHYLSDQFADALEREIREQHAWMKENFTWVECNNPPCTHCGRGGSKYRTLVWNEEL